MKLCVGTYPTFVEVQFAVEEIGVEPTLALVSMPATSHVEAMRYTRFSVRTVTSFLQIMEESISGFLSGSQLPHGAGGDEHTKVEVSENSTYKSLRNTAASSHENGCNF